MKPQLCYCILRADGTVARSATGRIWTYENTFQAEQVACPAIGDRIILCEITEVVT